MSKLIIAIDGFSSCGKSTLAKNVAKWLGYRYIDSGAMYRAVTLYFLDNNIDQKDSLAINLALNNIDIDFKNIDGINTTFLNDQNVETDIRTMKISREVSPVSTISAVRSFLVHQQKKMGLDGAIVMDGRDIGTVVFPNAPVKIFVIADTDIRTERRVLELQQRGMETSYESVKENLETRDRIDSTRLDSPLKQAEDAVVLDNTHDTIDSQLEKAKAIIQPFL